MRWVVVNKKYIGSASVGKYDRAKYMMFTTLDCYLFIFNILVYHTLIHLKAVNGNNKVFLVKHYRTNSNLTEIVYDTLKAFPPYK